MNRALALFLLVACNPDPAGSDDSSGGTVADAQPATMMLTSSDSSCSGVEDYWWDLYDFGELPKGVSMLYCARNGTDDDGEPLWLCEPFTGWRLWGSTLQWNCQVSGWNGPEDTYLQMSYW